MWKEIISFKDMEEIALVRHIHGCAVNSTPEEIKSAIEKKPDCHYYYYKSDTIELVKGFKLMPDHIFILSYTIKADIKDYPEAIRLMGEKSKEYLSTRNCKKLIVGYGSADETSVNFYNKGVSKIGLTEVVKIVKEEYEKLGFTVTYEDKQIVVEL